MSFPIRLAVAGMIAGLCWSAPSAAAPTADARWLTSYPQAVKEAKRTGKVILADFTGSDWCGWCIRLKAEVPDYGELSRRIFREPENARLHYEPARLNHRLGDKITALRDLRNAIKLDGKRPEYYVLLGRVHNSCWDSTDHFQKALDLDPECLPALVARAQWKAGREDRVGALLDIDQALNSTEDGKAA